MNEQAFNGSDDRVQDHLIGPLVRMGLRKQSTMPSDSYDAMLASFRKRLAYMSADRLDALCEVVGGQAGGKDRNRWPDEISVLNWAARLQPPPPGESRLVRSYMGSAAGRRALQQDYAVELFQYLRQHGHPPSDFAVAGMREQAAARQEDFARITLQIGEGRADPRERQAMERYWKTFERIVALVGTAAGRGQRDG